MALGICEQNRHTVSRIRARMSSGSAASDADMSPTRSQNSTLMTFRSSASPPCSAGCGAAHSGQNLGRFGVSAPQRQQALTLGSYVAGR
jgi:hypothetical protein